MVNQQEVQLATWSASSYIIKVVGSMSSSHTPPPHPPHTSHTAHTSSSTTPLPQEHHHHILPDSLHHTVKLHQSTFYWITHNLHHSQHNLPYIHERSEHPLPSTYSIRPNTNLSSHILSCRSSTVSTKVTSVARHHRRFLHQDFHPVVVATLQVHYDRNPNQSEPLSQCV